MGILTTCFLPADLKGDLSTLDNKLQEYIAAEKGGLLLNNDSEKINDSEVKLTNNAN